MVTSPQHAWMCIAQRKHDRIFSLQPGAIETVVKQCVSDVCPCIFHRGTQTCCPVSLCPACTIFLLRENLVDYLSSHHFLRFPRQNRKTGQLGVSQLGKVVAGLGTTNNNNISFSPKALINMKSPWACSQPSLNTGESRRLSNFVTETWWEMGWSSDF